jgi:hypothetical protein
MRIPGGWSEPRELIEQLPPGCRCTLDALILADGSEFELNPLDADEQFAEIFASGCPKLPTDDERERIENYKVNICLTGAGGSIAAAKQLMEAAAAVLSAGAAGVFVDNSGIAHGATDWLTLLSDAENGGVYWAFVNAVRSEDELNSIGMHVLGVRDAIIPLTGHDEYDFRTLHSFLGFTAFSGNVVTDGDTIGDPVLPTFRAQAEPHDRVPENAPMFNPYGQWRLVPVDGQLN